VATETYALSIQGGHNAEYVENVLHFTGSGLTADATLTNGTSLIAGFKANAEALWLLCIPPTYNLQRYAARRVITKPSATATAYYEYAVQSGTRGSQSISNNVCPSIFLVPPTGVKSGGRIFMPCVDQLDVVQNLFVAGYLTAISNFMNNVTTGWASSGITWQLAIYSRKLNVAHPVSSWTVSDRLGFQGRRRSPVGA
jgi:hypothetical protein